MFSPNLKAVEVGHLQAQPSAPALDILDQIPETVDQIFAPALDASLENDRIGRDKIGRRQRVDELARVELRLVMGMRIDPLDAANRRLKEARHQQIRLLHVVEDRGYRSRLAP